MKKFMFIFLLAVVFALSGKAYYEDYYLYGDEDGNSVTLYDSDYDFGSVIDYVVVTDPLGTNKGQAYLRAIDKKGKYLVTKLAISFSGEYDDDHGLFIQDNINKIKLYAQKSGYGGYSLAMIGW